jgi:hypothetical protein
MNLELKKESVPNFEDSVPKLAPWMHAMKFSDSTYVGYYKYFGLPFTFSTSKSPTTDIEKITAAYHSVDHSVQRRFFSKIMDSMTFSDRSKATVLDISGATGEKSMWAVDAGFGKVISSEIRALQCDQQKLIYSSLADSKYEKSIQVSNDLVSADDAAFIDLYKGKGIDVVMSFGLLYHLTNPWQHILNLKEITNKYAVIYTLTHFHPFRKKHWKLEIEDAGWITKATSSVCWIGHFQEVADLCKKAGFKKVTVLYPDVFEKNFGIPKKNSRLADMRLLGQIALSKIGLKTGHMKNQDFKYFKNFGVNPNYFAYVLEK